jgi:DNA sulfur modification protein DndD
MIIESIRLENVGAFGGTHNIDLSPTSTRRPVTIIGGLNGAGKTTLLDALQVGFFGRLAEPVRRESAGYSAYLSGLIHRRAKQSDGAAIEICFRAIGDGAERSYRVARTWYVRNGRVTENVEVHVDDQYDRVFSDSWAQQVDRFIPARLSHLFFFDGEQIEAMANPARSSAILRTAVHALFGLDLVDQLHGDLGALRTRTKANAAEGEERVEMARLEKDLATTEGRVVSLRAKLARLTTEQDKASALVERKETQFRQQGGELVEQRGALTRERDAAIIARNKTKSDLVELASGSLPLHLVLPLLRKTSKQLQIESVGRERRLVHQILTDRDDRMLQVFRQNKMSASALRIAHAFVDKEIDKERPSDLEFFIDAESRTSQEASHLTSHILKSERKACGRLLRRYSELCEGVDEAESKLQMVPDDEAIRRVLDERNNAIKGQVEATARVDQAKESLVEAERECDRVRSLRDAALQQVQMSNLKRKDLTRFVNATRRVDETLRAFRAKVLSTRLARLETAIAYCLRQLMRKKTLIKKLRIDGSSFELKLLDSQDNVVAADRLSAGERQLLAAAVLWGLARSSGRTLPVVIDTPLGRLDSHHRGNLVENYFGKASKQVILLSTDEEITGKYFDMLKPAIGRMYLIEHDENRETSMVSPAYFEGN